MKLDSIVYCGTPDFSIPILELLCSDLYKKRLKVVLTRPDAPKGRGKKLSPSPIKSKAKTLGIPVYEPSNKTSFADHIKKLNPDLVLVAAYGIILPPEIVNTYFCVNVHASLLPQYRGASPIHAALLNQDKETGISLFRMNEKMDEGEILYTFPVPISDTDNLKTLHNKLSLESVKAVTHMITDIINGKEIITTAQNENKASYCKKLVKADSVITATDELSSILAKIKAFSPNPGATLVLNNQTKIKILEATIQNETLIPTVVKPEGKSQMSYHDYCLGHPEGIPPLGRKE